MIECMEIKKINKIFIRIMDRKEVKKIKEDKEKIEIKGGRTS
jgi:hypothetical protein